MSAMSWFVDGYWPWWAGAIALATVTCLVWLVERRLLGVSGAYRQVLRRRSQDERAFEEADDSSLEDAMLQATLQEFGPEAMAEMAEMKAALRAEEADAEDVVTDRREPRRGGLPQSANVAFLAMVPVGGFLAALLSGQFEVRPVLDDFHAELFGGVTLSLLVLLVGGLLVGFGTRMSGGCTSGHGLSGCGRMDPASLLATAVFFGTAIAVSFLLQAVLS
jgi:hypothetical protein